MQMIAIKAWLVTNMGERSMLLGFELAFKCQQHVSLTAYNRMRARELSKAPFLDGALLWQHAAVCLLVLLFYVPPSSMCWLLAREDGAVNQLSRTVRVRQIGLPNEASNTRYCTLSNFLFLFILENISIKKHWLKVELTEFLSLLILNRGNHPLKP